MLETLQVTASWIEREFRRHVKQQPPKCIYIGNAIISWFSVCQNPIAHRRSLLCVYYVPVAHVKSPVALVLSNLL